MQNQLLETVNQLPKSPGVYQYFDENSRLLYVGKAKNLFNRVRSYFAFSPKFGPKSNLSARIYKMITEVRSMEYLVVDTEHDALILENSLIKQLNPKYNILLRDDKTYPYLLIDHTAPFPRIELTRKIIKDKQFEYFGPFSTGARDIMDSIYELLPLVQKKSCVEGGKACLYYQIKKCLAPCEGKISSGEYQKIVKEATRYIKEKDRLIADIEKQMLRYAEELRFEEAKELRDRMQSIEKSRVSTPIDLAASHNYDIFAIALRNSKAVLVKLFMREGRVISNSFTPIRLGEAADVQELYYRAIVDYYTTHETIIPSEILTLETLEEKEALEELLSEHAGKKVTLNAPQKGDKRKVTELAYKNAVEQLDKELQKHRSEDELLEEIQRLFKLENRPDRIEVFDNSHLQGVAQVGAMICYENGSFDKSGYRLYHLEAQNEYEQMRETLSRRIESFSKNSPPDLWLLDGGKALLELARSLLHEAHIHIDVLAIAKEKVDAKAHRAKGKAKDIVSSKDEAFRLPTSDRRLQLLQKLRDEAHRSAINFHKKTKLKLDKESDLLSLSGIGPAKVKRLLNYFGSFESIKNASFEELRSIMNEKDANLIKKFYN